jgi:hypothetical protein
MLVIGVCGAAVLAVICWAALREAAPVAEPFIPQSGSEGHDGRSPDDDGPAGEGERQRADGQGVPPESVAGGRTRPGALGDATVADADTDEALAAAVALWGVLGQRPR